MSYDIYQTDNDRRDNLREILRISYERCNQIKNISNQLVAIMAAIFIGLLTITINSFASQNLENKYLIILAIHFIIATILIWRYYSHFIDNELVSCYKKILFCEEKLEIPFEISLASWLEKTIEFELPPKHKDSIELNRKKKYLEQNDKTKNLIIQKLIERNRSGYRFHNLWDNTAGLSIVVILLYQLFYILSNPDVFPLDFLIMVTIFFPVGYLTALWALTRDLKNNIAIQRDPTNAELENIINEIANSKSI